MIAYVVILVLAELQDALPDAGFNISLEPGFSVSRLCWMLAYGGIYAVANLRCVWYSPWVSLAFGFAAQQCAGVCCKAVKTCDGCLSPAYTHIRSFKA